MRGYNTVFSRRKGNRTATLNNNGTEHARQSAARGPAMKLAIRESQNGYALQRRHECKDKREKDEIDANRHFWMTSGGALHKLRVRIGANPALAAHKKVYSQSSSFDLDGSQMSGRDESFWFLRRGWQQVSKNLVPWLSCQCQLPGASRSLHSPHSRAPCSDRDTCKNASQD